MTPRLIITALSLLILQAGLGPLLTIGFARPSFLLPFVVFVGISSGPLWGCLTGFALGLAVDALGGLPLGMSALACCGAGFFSAKLAADAPFRLWFPWTVLVLLFASVFELLRLLLLARANQLPFLSLMLWSGIPSALWTTALAALWFLSPLHKSEGAVR